MRAWLVVRGSGNGGDRETASGGRRGQKERFHLVLYADVCAVVEEQLHDVGVAVGRRTVQRGTTLRAGAAAAALRGGGGAGGAGQGVGQRRRPVRGRCGARRGSAMGVAAGAATADPRKRRVALLLEY